MATKTGFIGTKIKGPRRLALTKYSEVRAQINREQDFLRSILNLGPVDLLSSDYQSVARMKENLDAEEIELMKDFVKEWVSK